MKQWDIYNFPFSVERTHPAVILSVDEACDNAQIKEVNVLLCSSAEANRGPKPNEIPLDRQDGLDWKTMVRCQKNFLIDKDKLEHRIGSVSNVRRREIGRKIIELFRLPYA